MVYAARPGAYGPSVNIGWPPRVGFFTYMVWVVTLGCEADAPGERDDKSGKAIWIGYSDAVLFSVCPFIPERSALFLR